MSTANTNSNESATGVCPVAQKLRTYARSFDVAAQAAIELKSDLSVALGGERPAFNSFTLADFQAIDVEELERVEEQLDDLNDQIEYVMEILQQVIELRTDADADWDE